VQKSKTDTIYDCVIMGGRGRVEATGQGLIPKLPPLAEPRGEFSFEAMVKNGILSFTA